MPDIIHPNPKSTKVSLWSMVHGLWSTIMVFGLLSMVLFSCTTQKQLTYLNGVDDAGPENFYPSTLPEYRLQQQDILYISIVTLNEEVNLMLNPGGSLSTQQISQGQVGSYLMGYSINDSGYINIPVIGDVFVLKKTLNEVTNEIEAKTSLMFKDARVVIKLLSYRITVLGEVKLPGNHVNYGNRLTILDAIGLAGDLTDFGDRSRVLLVRPSKDGTHTFRINLKDKNLLTSEKYFLLPNDILIVEPRKNKLLSLNAPAVSLFLNSVVSSITLTLLILSLNK